MPSAASKRAAELVREAYAAAGLDAADFAAWLRRIADDFAAKQTRQ